MPMQSSDTRCLIPPQLQYRFKVSPLKDTKVQRGIVQPANGHKGGGAEVIFTDGTTDRVLHRHVLRGHAGRPSRAAHGFEDPSSTGPWLLRREEYHGPSTTYKYKTL